MRYLLRRLPKSPLLAKGDRGDFIIIFYAHSLEGKFADEWQLLEEHMKNVTEIVVSNGSLGYIMTIEKEWVE